MSKFSASTVPGIVAGTPPNAAVVSTSGDGLGLGLGGRVDAAFMVKESKLKFDETTQSQKVARPMDRPPVPLPDLAPFRQFIIITEKEETAAATATE